MGFADMSAIVMSLALALMAAVALVSLYRVHRDPAGPSLLDLLTATDRAGKVRFDARKCFEAGAWCVSTWAFVYLVIASRLTEWFYVGYLGTWVTARWLRDREKRLNPVGKNNNQETAP